MPTSRSRRQWLSLPGDVRDAQLGIKLENGVLRAPVQGASLAWP